MSQLTLFSPKEILPLPEIDLASFAALPYELISQIITPLSAEDIAQVRLVNSTLAREIKKDATLWRKKFQQYFPQDYQKNLLRYQTAKNITPNILSDKFWHNEFWPAYFVKSEKALSKFPWKLNLPYISDAQIYDLAFLLYLHLSPDLPTISLGPLLLKLEKRIKANKNIWPQPLADKIRQFPELTDAIALQTAKIGLCLYAEYISDELGITFLEQISVLNNYPSPSQTVYRRFMQDYYEMAESLVNTTPVGEIQRKVNLTSPFLPSFIKPISNPSEKIPLPSERWNTLALITDFFDINQFQMSDPLTIQWKHVLRSYSSEEILKYP